MFIKNLFRNPFYTLVIMLFLQTNITCKQASKLVIITKEGGSFIKDSTSKRLIDGFQKKYRSSKYPLVSTLDIANAKQLLQTHGATNIRIYYGEDRSKMINLVAVAADDQGVDIVGKLCMLITKAGASLIPVATAASYTHQFQKDYQDSTDFPYAEKFNLKYITVLLGRTGADRLSIYLGNDVNGLDKKIKKIQMIIFAVNNIGVIIRGTSRTGKIRSANPTYRMAGYYFEDEESGVENGQHCLYMCNINSSPLYQAQPQ